MNKKRAYIFDMDGTLANVDHRRDALAERDENGAWVKKKKPDWDRWHSEQPNDPVWEGVAEIYTLLIKYSNAAVIVVSGRWEEHRTNMVDWMKANNLPLPHAICMRQDGDYRADDIIKEEIYINRIQPYYEVIGVFDDRDRVVQMWRRNGLPTYQVAEGAF